MANVSKNRMITAWTSFLTMSLIFMLIGYLIFYTPGEGIPWWCWFVPAIALIEAIRVTITYLAGEHTRICPNCQEKTSISSQFCEKCGHDLRAVTYQTYGKIEVPEPEHTPDSNDEPKSTPYTSSKKYCITCGGPLDGKEAYCPTCGMPNPGN